MKSLSSFKTSEIRSLFRTARTLLTIPGLTLKGAPKKLEYGKILIITPKKMGNAPERNLMRRRLKSIFYEQRLFEGPYDIIAFVNHEALELPFETLQKLMITSFHEDCS